MSDDPEFPGFDIPTANWFKMPNAWTNITARMSSIAEMKVVEYILRHTWGFQEFGIKKRISVDEFRFGRWVDGKRFDQGTGLAEQSVRNGLAAALARGLIEEHVDASDLGRIKKSYAIKMREVQDLDLSHQDLETSAMDPRPRTKKDTNKESTYKSRKKKDAPPATYDPAEHARRLAASWDDVAITGPENETSG